MKILVNKNEINIKYADSYKDKLIGFMFYKKKINYGICFKNVKSIHTFFMMQNIDVIQTDINNKIISIYENVPKNKVIIGKKNVYNTYELPLGTAKFYKVDDYIKLKL